jgi:hypothetical protein
MSEYSTSSVTITAQPQRARIRRRLLDRIGEYADVEVPTVQQVDACGTTRPIETTGSLIERQRAALVAEHTQLVANIQATGGAVELISRVHPAASEALRPDASQLAEMSLIGGAVRELRTGVQKAAHELRTTERLTVAEEFADALRLDLGYDIGLHHGLTSSGLVGARGGEYLALVITSDGIRFDHQTCEAGACADRMRDIERVLARRGIHLDHVSSRRHDDPSGGPLLRGLRTAATSGRPTDLARTLAERTDNTQPTGKGLGSVDATHGRSRQQIGDAT